MKKWFESKEAKKITVIGLVSCIVLIIQVLGFLHFNIKLYDLSVEHSVQQTEEISHYIEKNLYMELEHRIHILKIIEVQLEKEGPELTSKIIHQVMLPYSTSDFKLMGICDLDGNGIDSNGNAYNIRYEHIREAMERNEVYISNVLRNESETLLFVAVPMKIEGKICGIIWGKQTLTDVVEHIDFQNDSYKYFQIIDDQGSYLFASNNKHILAKRPELGYKTMWEEMKQYSYLSGDTIEEIKKKVEQGQTGNFYFEVNGEGRYVSYRPLNINKWYLFSVQVDDGLYDFVFSTREVAVNFFVLLGIGFLIIFGCIYHLIYTMYRKNVGQSQKIQQVNAVLRTTLEQTKNIPFTINQKDKQVTFYGYPRKDTIKCRTFAQMDSEVLLKEGILDQSSLETYQKLYQNLLVDKKKCAPVIIYAKVSNKKTWLRVSITSDDADSAEQMLGVLEDYGEQREKDLQIKTHLDDIKKIAKKSQMDYLTNVYNREAFVTKLHNALQQNLEGNQTGALLILDLDHFKEINDQLGHGMGDMVLQKVANTLSGFFRKEDIVGRLGGDEFVVFVQNIWDVNAFEQRIKKLNQLLCTTYQKDGQAVLVSASIGIMFTDQDHSTFEMLYEKADQALYQVKQSTRNGYRIYKKRRN